MNNPNRWIGLGFLVLWAVFVVGVAIAPTIWANWKARQAIKKIENKSNS